MKILIVGAAHQAKTDYAAAEFDIDAERITFNNVHMLVRALLENGEEPMTFILEKLDDMPDWTVICDEIGGGVVPIDAMERRWREETGRLCCAIAERADIVDRVTCGLPIRLKGDKDKCMQHSSAMESKG